jgi:segregation and condensation protein A
MVDVEGFEGPLDLLLMLARQQKVDLAKISVLALAEQYLAFIEAARKLRLELAADYLVMAAWLAYLKSRLLLPEPTGPDQLSAEDMANALAWRLKRLEAIGQATDWSRLDQFLLDYLVEPSMRSTVIASSLAATLELVREGAMEVHQQSAFAPIYLRKREAAQPAPTGATTPRATE